MIQLGVIIESIHSKVDKTWKITLSTQELPPEHIGFLSGHLQKYMNLMLKEDSITQLDISEFKAFESEITDTTKSPSQRLRNVFYVTWEQKPEGYDDFNRYYEYRMNKLIELLKSKLD